MILSQIFQLLKSQVPHLQDGSNVTSSLKVFVKDTVMLFLNPPLRKAVVLKGSEVLLVVQLMGFHQFPGIVLAAESP